MASSENIEVTGKRRKPNELPFAHWRVTLGGKDLTQILDPLLFRVSITEKRGKEADQLEIEIWDKNGTVELPKIGAKINCEIGWKRGKNLPLGLVNKGTFKVDDVSMRGINGTINISAKSADFTGEFNKRRKHSYINKNMGQILDDIASRCGYGVLCDENLKSETIPSIINNSQSDSALLKSLGKRFDAVATIKNDKIIFAKIAGDKTAKGTQTPVFTIDVTNIEPKSFDYGAADRENHNGVEAEYHDKKTGQKKKILHGHDPKNPKPPQKLKRTHHNEKNAHDHAKSHHQSSKRGAVKCSFQLPLGRPDLFPNAKIKLSNFKKEVSAKNWVIEEIQTEMGANGLKTSLTLESF